MKNNKKYISPEIQITFSAVDDVIMGSPIEPDFDTLFFDDYE